jgi:hypothetical protein
MTDQDKGQDLKRTVKYLLIFCLVWLAVDIGVALWTHSLQGIEIRTGAGTTRLGSLTALMILPFLWPAARGIRWAIDITLWLLFLFAAFALIAAIELAFRVTLTVGGDRIPQGGIAYFAVWFELLGIGVCSALLAQSLRRNAPPKDRAKHQTQEERQAACDALDALSQTPPPADVLGKGPESGSVLGSK